MSRRRNGGGAALALLFVALLSVAAPAPAHPVQFTTLQVRVAPDGQFHAVLNIDILAFALHLTSQQSTNAQLQTILDGPRAALGNDLADAGNRFRQEVVVRTNSGRAAVTSWTLPGLPEVDAVLALHLHPSILMPGEIRFSGILPARASSLTIRLPYVLGDTIHVYELPHGEGSDQPVPAGSYSTPVTFQLESSSERFETLGRYLVTGLREMIPDGPDHVLFVLGLLLLGARTAPLLRQVGAFTLAHSLTLALFAYGIIRPPFPLTETLVAASILVIALGNIFATDLQPRRLLVVFGFGLVHGFAFGHALLRAGLPLEDRLVGLVGFNLGLEVGQLIVILGALLAVGWFRHRAWFRKRIALPLSFLLAVVGAGWTVHRLFWPN